MAWVFIIKESFARASYHIFDTITPEDFAFFSIDTKERTNLIALNPENVIYLLRVVFTLPSKENSV